MRILKFFSSSLCTLALFMLLAPTAFGNILLPNIDVDGDSTVDIDVNVFNSDSDFCNNRSESDINFFSIFAVHGINSQATDWGFFVPTLLNDNPTSVPVCRVYAIDMPGRGGSGLPTEKLFSQLNHTDYANIILNVLREMNDQGMSPRAIMTHSNGGINIQVAQEILADQGTSLSEEFGITKVTMFAPVPSAPTIWPFGDQLANILETFADCFSGDGIPFPVNMGCEEVDFDPDGDIDFDDLFTADPSGRIYDCDPNTVPIGVNEVPDNCEMNTVLGDRTTEFLNNGAPPEPLTIVRSIFGADPQVRPVTTSGIFGGIDQATLNIVAFEDDEALGPSSALEALFNNLLGGPNGRYLNILDEDGFNNHIHLFFDPLDTLQRMADNDMCLVEEPVRNVPTLSEWGYIALSVLVMVAGVYYLRFRRQSDSNA